MAKILLKKSETKFPEVYTYKKMKEPEYDMILD